MKDILIRSGIELFVAQISLMISNPRLGGISLKTSYRKILQRLEGTRLVVKFSAVALKYGMRLRSSATCQIWKRH